ncbi:MAG: carbohydrate kinase family protein, partial [Candidatus Saccharimonadales bacterium]
AATFVKHGFEVGFMGKIGDDPAGKHILTDLQSLGVDTSMVKCDLDGTTGYSTLLLAPRGERTILVYRGVSQELKASDFNHFAKLRTDWLYISSLSGNFPLLESLIHYAKTHDIKLAINPGHEELKQSKRLVDLLDNFAVVSLNKEEAQMLVKGNRLEELAAKLAKHAKIAVVTNGAKGSCASDGEYTYKAGLYKDSPVLDRTGAGDGFTSGFVAKIAAGEDIEKALTFASANSTSIVEEIGAKNGILSKGAKIKKMPITKKEIA